MTEIQLSRIHFPVEVLGPGVRVGIWLQGCTIACPGCVSKDTWSPSGGVQATIDQVVDSVVDLCAGYRVDGLTISGGEPFEQPEALAELIPRLRRSLAPLAPYPGIDVMVYSGLRSSVIHQRFAPILGLIDVLVPEPFRPSSGHGDTWRGSSNQPIELLSDLGKARFTGPLESASNPKRIQMSVDDETIWMIGIPGEGDMHELEALLADRGVSIHEASWRS